MKVALGADHGGFDLKSSIAQQLRQLGHEVVDVGTSSREAVDYPLFAHAVAVEVASGRCDRGIMIDGAGIGSAMAANKVRGIRAALAYDLSSARNSREHNDANVLTLGAGLIGPRLAEQIVAAWLETACTEDRHLRRVAQIEEGVTASSVGGPTQSGTEAARGPRASRSDLLRGSPPGSLEISAPDLDRIARELQRILGSPSGFGSGGRSAGPSAAQDPESARRLLQLGARRIGGSPGDGRVPDDIAGYIDHTLLRPDATAAQITTLCAEAREYSFAAVCVNPVWIALVAKELRGSPVKACSVVGFPLGATPPENKALETRRAIRDGAKEIDMVIQIGALKGGDDETVGRDIRAVVEASRDGGAICKVIIEAAFLNDDEKRRACRLSRRAGAHFVKTSTGFGPGGATAADVALMAAEVSEAGMEVKAAGGVRTYTDAVKMIEAGATRIGSSAGVAIVHEARGARVGA